jgi:hypothetical protein
MLTKFNSVLVGLTLLLFSLAASAQVDVSEATDSIASAVTGGSTVLIALIGAFGLFLGYKIVMGIVKRG